MLIVCPNCKKRFDVDPGTPDEAKRFRCSSCRAVFRLVRRAQGEAGEKAAAPAPVPPLPPAAPPASAEGDRHLRSQSPAVPPAAPSAAPARGDSGRLKVVIANESAAFCEAVRKVLAVEPFEVFVCNDGKVALDTVERVRPELLLLDVALPTMFGFEVCERVRQNPALSEVKIVLIASIYDKTRYKRAPHSLYGADDYIEKHHIPDALIPMIYGLTSGSIPAVSAPSPGEWAAQQESRQEIREAEVRETSPAAPEDPDAPPVPRSAPAPAAGASDDDPANWTFASLADAAPAAPVVTVAAVSEPPVAEPSFATSLQAAPPVLPEAHQKARRLARIIVSDIVLYNQGKVELGVRDGNLYDLLADDIREGERLYRQRVAEDVRESTSYLTDAFEDLIAKKRAELRI